MRRLLGWRALHSVMYASDDDASCCMVIESYYFLVYNYCKTGGYEIILLK